MKEYHILENCYKWNNIWIMFDLDNGHVGYRTYFWVFPTKKEALKHRSKQHKKKFAAKLSYPKNIKA
jgi:hypothetical protein